MPVLRRGLQQAAAVREPQMPSAVPRWAVLPVLEDQARGVRVRLDGPHRTVRQRAGGRQFIPPFYIDSVWSVASLLSLPLSSFHGSPPVSHLLKHALTNFFVGLLCVDSETSSLSPAMRQGQEGRLLARQRPRVPLW